MTTIAHTVREPRLRRALDPQLPRPVWILQAGLAVNALGNGMVMPFLVIYLHNVRGFSLSVAGLVAASFGAFSLVSIGAGGALADRVGARRILAVTLVLSAVGYGLFPLVRSPWHAFAFMAIAGLGNGAFWPAQTSLTVAHTPEDRRHAAFALNRASFNLGVGLGGLAGGLIATTGEPSTFTILFVVDAVTFVLFAALLGLVPAVAPPKRAQGVRPGRYADVLRDRPFVAFVALNAVFVIVGFAQLEATFPVFAKNDAGMAERAIGVMFLLNVVVIVAAQMPIARLLEGRSRMRTLALMAAIWGASWIGMLAAGIWLEALAAAAALTVAVVVFAVGECLHAPAQGGLVADLARPELRGRYFALSTYSYAVGFTLGPALGGILLDASAGLLWPAVAAACLAAAAAALALERRLPEGVRVTPRRA